MMKTIRSIAKKVLLFCVIFTVVSIKSYAQWNPSKAHCVIDWQMNAPVATGFVEKISGWGMNFEGTYDITSHWALGAFVNFHSNRKYIDRQTIALSSTESLTTDQQRSAFQLPFGVTTSYNLRPGRVFRPYVGAKMGAMFARNTTYFGINGRYDEGRGFYISPEIGLKIHPFRHCRLGFHVAGFYNYATNHTRILLSEVDGQSNLGFRLGVIF